MLIGFSDGDRIVPISTLFGATTWLVGEKQWSMPFAINTPIPDHRSSFAESPARNLLAGIRTDEVDKLAV